jgi:hypothetical protein
LGIYLGVETVFTPPGYLVLILLLFVLPYIVGCVLNSLLKKK